MTEYKSILFVDEDGIYYVNTNSGTIEEVDEEVQEQLEELFELIEDN